VFQGLEETEEAVAEEDDAEGEVELHVYLLAVAAIVLESCIASSVGVFMQWVFRDQSAFWVRNVQFAAVSIALYACVHVARDTPESCNSVMHLEGLIVALIQGERARRAEIEPRWGSANSRRQIFSAARLR